MLWIGTSGLGQLCPVYWYIPIPPITSYNRGYRRSCIYTILPIDQLNRFNNTINNISYYNNEFINPYIIKSLLLNMS